MAVNSFTVADFLRSVRFKLRKHNAGSAHKLDIIAAMEEAKSQIWRLLVASDNGWFIVQSVNSPGNDLHFPDLTDATRAYDLPPAFHQMYYVDVTTAGKEDFEFLNTQMRDKKYREKRRTTTAANAASTEREYYYDIVGINPAKFVLAEGLPSGETLAVTLFFVRLLDRWTAEGDSVDDMILPFMPAVSTRAAQLVAAGLKDRELALELRQEWESQLEEIMAISRRLIADPHLTAGLSDDFRPKKVTEGGKL